MKLVRSVIVGIKVHRPVGSPISKHVHLSKFSSEKYDMLQSGIVRPTICELNNDQAIERKISVGPIPTFIKGFGMIFTGLFLYILNISIVHAEQNIEENIDNHSFYQSVQNVDSSTEVPIVSSSSDNVSIDEDSTNISEETSQSAEKSEKEAPYENPFSPVLVEELSVTNPVEVSVLIDYLPLLIEYTYLFSLWHSQYSFCQT